MATVATTTRPPFWRNVRVLRLAGQVAFVLVVLVVLREGYLNMEFAMRELGIDLSFDFLDQRAGFGIGEGISYNPNQSFLKAFMVGVVNAIFVAIGGIVLATVVGVVMGVARLSPNWIMRKIAHVYVEIVRNIPPLVQIIFLYTAVILAIPAIGESISVGGIAFVSNRGGAIPWPRAGADIGAWLLFVAAGVVAAAFVWRWRTRVNEDTGRPSYRVLGAMGTVVAVALVGYVVVGDAFTIDVPQLGERSYTGGLQMTPEFAGILLGLVIYTGAFIAEIVRGSIQAVPKGQKEAAQALGLRPGQQLRLVVLPQAMRIALPAINSQYLNLTKNTSLAFAIGFPEIINITQTITNQAGRFVQVFLMMVVAYLLLSLIISAAMNGLNYLIVRRGTRR
ncbi:MAG TPA: ABC transporter permease subunit [Actinomycetota bacterium]|nr:ABC transporter permease subunit [Actinomycetota bacterium]